MAGRPFAHHIGDKELRAMARMAGYGMSERSIGYCLGIPETTWHRYKGDDPRIAEALAKGLADAAALVGKVLLQKALDGDLGAICWWEKTRQNRFERSRQEVTGPDGGPIEHKAMEPSAREQINRELDRLASRAGAGVGDLSSRRNGGD